MARAASTWRATPIRCGAGLLRSRGGRRPDHRQPVAPFAGARRRPLRPLPRPADRRRRRALPGARRSVRARRRSGALRARRSGATRRSRGDRAGVRGALLGRRHAAPHRLRVPGPAAVALRQRGALTCTSCHGMHDGDPRGQLRARFAAGGRRRTHVHRLPRGARRRAAGARVPRAPRSGRRGGGGRCVGCHMPRIVYGVLDVHRSHRIEVPDPARAAAAGRPDACTGCHVERDGRLGGGSGAPALGRGALCAGRRSPDGDRRRCEALFGGAPVARATAADALGAGPPAPTRGAAGASRRGAARCHGGGRATRRCGTSPGAACAGWSPRPPPRAAGFAADYDASADARPADRRGRPAARGTRPSGGRAARGAHRSAGKVGATAICRWVNDGESAPDDQPARFDGRLTRRLTDGRRLVGRRSRPGG